jgi:hypothetical protein
VNDANSELEFGDESNEDYFGGRLPIAELSENQITQNSK